MSDHTRTVDELESEVAVLRARMADLERLEAQRENAERALRESEARYRGFVEHFEGIAFRGGFDWRPIFFHGAVERITGYSEKDFVNGAVTWEAVIHPEDRASRDFHSTELREVPGFGLELDYRIIRRDGETRWVHQCVRNGCDEAGRPAFVEGVIYDISARKQAEEELRRTRKEWQEIFQAVGHPMMVLDVEHRILAANRATFLALGQTEQSILGRKCQELFHCKASAPPENCPLESLLRSGRMESIEMEMEAMGGSYLVSCTPIADDSGGLIRIIHVATDITALKKAEARHERLEAQLRHAQKMEAVGRLAGGVAHDFNNLLTVISGNLELLTLRLGQAAEPGMAELLEQIAAAAQRGAALTRQLLMFSRKELPRPQVLDLNAIVRGMEPMLRRLIGEHIAFDINLSERLDAVVADKPQMEQVLMNLALNARDAMPGGGRLTIQTTNVVLDDDYVRNHVEARVGRHVMLAVADTGAGMDAATQEHIFEPFFTTKSIDKGVGLGLSIVYGIIRQSGGHVTVESQVGQGTALRVYLAGVKVQDGPPVPPAVGWPQGGKETVLLCEDEEGVRYIARAALSKAGYSVLEAEDGREALKLAQDHPDAIDLLVTDLVMPQMTGRELAAALRATRPLLGVIIMSGYSSGMIDDATLRDERLDFLAKPFQLTELLRLVRAVLDRTAKA